MARGGVTLVVVISVTMAFTLSFSFGLWQFLQRNVADPILGPLVRIGSLSFSEGQCETEYILWVIPSGEHRIVIADFVLENEGLTDGKATLVFTVDGQIVGDHTFYIAAGQDEAKTHRFHAGDCAGHTYSAYIGDVVRA